MEYNKTEFSQFCAPLWLSKPFMQDGHDANKANATVTFIKYKGKGYAVTCAHVYYQQKIGADEFRELTLFGNSPIIVSFFDFSLGSPASAFRPLIDDSPKANGPDIAIAPANFAIQQYMKDNNKEWLDLDSWEEPDWSINSPKVAVGYATEHKSTDGKYVLSGFVQAVAESPSGVESTRDKFMLFSQLEEEHEVFFSGMSGGPVFYQYEDDREAVPIGIIYEGSPGSSLEWEKRGHESFLTGSHIKIDAQLLTPNTFKEWLSIAGLNT